jgi:hypothetical protein
MGFAAYYLGRQKGFKPHFAEAPSPKLRYTVIIPAFCEPGLTGALESLWNCTRPAGHCEIIVVINSPDNAGPEILSLNRSSRDEVIEWISSHQDPSFQTRVIDIPDFPVKDAGVGLARKTGMDEALYRYDLLGNPNGYILSFDADSICDVNYFTAIEEAICENPSVKAFDVYFEHPVSGGDYPAKVYEGITDYELHLRYVNQFLRFTGFPFAQHTVGSCFGVRADIYAAQGGMNKKKAGEDFYFLHKVIPLGNFIDIHTTRVIPSPRESFRVPFGTGPAISRYLASDTEMQTYSPECFTALRQFFKLVPGFFKANPETIYSCIDLLPVSLREFLKFNTLFDILVEINGNSGSRNAFCNRFYRWFDAFRIVKYLNFASREYYPKIGVAGAARHLLQVLGYGDQYNDRSPLELLEAFRIIERGG